MEAATFELIRRLVDDHRYEEALTQIAQGAGRWSEVSATSLKREIYMKLGELHRALGEVNRLRKLEPSRATNESARRLLGRIIETDISWLPGTTQIDHAPATGGRRVLHLLKESIPYSETGFTMRSRTTLTAQKLAGFDPQVITSLGFPRNKGISDFPDNHVVEGVRHHHLDLGPAVDTRAMPFDAAISESARLASPLVAMIQPDLIQAGTGYRGFETALLGIALARQVNIPIIYEVRGFQEHTWTGDIARSERGEYYRRRMRQEARCMSEADGVITIGEAMAAELASRGVEPDKLHVVPNAVDVNRFTPRPKRADLVANYGLEDRFVVGYISNLGPREGIDHLLRAVSLLRKKHPDIKCLIAGDGPERSVLDQLIEQLDIGDFVVMAGHVPNQNIEDHYALIDLFVVPRIDDRAARFVTPLKPLEAMAMRIPVITASLPALEELVQPGVRGLSFTPSDPSAIAETASELIKSPSALEKFSQSAFDWVTKERTLESNAGRYARILAPLLEEAPKRLLHQS